MQARTRVVDLIVIVATSCAMVAAAPALAITPSGDWARYTSCPLDDPTVDPILITEPGYCVWAETTGGQVRSAPRPCRS